MSKNTTTYVAIAGNDDEGMIIAKGAKRAAVIAAADAHRDETPAHTVHVVTLSGKVVFERLAKRSIRMSAPYTRVVAVPDEVVDLLDGARVAYRRGPKARRFALLDDARGAYRIFDIERNETVDVEVATTREAGRWFADERRAYADATPVDA